MTKSKPVPKTKPAPKPAASNTYRKYGHLWRLTPVDPRRRVDPIRLAAIDREIYILRYYHKIVEQSGKLQPGTMRVMPPGVPLHGVSYNNELMEWKEHLKTLVTLIWDRPDSNRRFKWNPYALRMLDAALEHKYLAVAGHASSGKSVFFAMWGILKFLIGAVHPDKPDTCDPGNVKVFLTSTSLDESRGRIWGDVEMFWNDLIVCVGGEQYLPAKLVSSAGKIIHLDAAGKRNEKAGLILVAGGKGRDADAESKIGFKARSVVMILDELPLLTHSFYKKVFTNLQSNAEFQCIGIGNPTSAFDPFGVFMEPKNGWKSINEDYMEWETTRGYCVRFDGEHSPNVLAGREIWPGLLTLQYLNEIRSPLGENYKNNAEYYRMIRGFLPPDGDTQAVYTEAEIIGSDSRAKVTTWVSTPIGIGFLDPAFSHGGDEANACFAKVGKFFNPVFQKEVLAIELVEVKNLMLDVNSKDTSKDRNEQLVEIFQRECEARGIALADRGLDATGAGDPLSTIFAMKMGHGFQSVSFAGAPSDKQVSSTDRRTGKERFANRVSELWGIGKELMLAGQIRGLDTDTCIQMCARLFNDKKVDKEKLEVESKQKMKARTNGRSPDRADAFFGCIEIARRRHNLSSAARAAVVKPAPRSQPQSVWDALTRRPQRNYHADQGWVSLQSTGAAWGG